LIVENRSFVYHRFMFNGPINSQYFTIPDDGIKAKLHTFLL